jgi:hypothetical protein
MSDAGARLVRRTHISVEIVPEAEISSWKGLSRQAPFETFVKLSESAASRDDVLMGSLLPNTVSVVDEMAARPRRGYARRQLSKGGRL